MRLKKRGIGLWETFGILIAVIVLIQGLRVGVAYGRDTVGVKHFLAKDLAFSINILYSIPGNIVTNYEVDTSKYTVEVDDNIVSAYEGSMDPTKRDYFYVKSGDDFPKVKLENVMEIALIKDSGKIRLKDMKEDIKTQSIQCEGIYIGATIHGKSIIAEIDEPYDSRTYWMASSLTSGRIMDSSMSVEEKIEELADEKPDVLVSIRIGEEPDEMLNPLTIHYPSSNVRKNNKVACEVANSLVGEFPEINKVTILPSEDIMINQIPDSINLLIIIGNTNFEDSEVLAKSNLVGNRIYEGLRSCYEDAKDD